MAISLSQIIDFLGAAYPLELSEEFDNTGLLVGHRGKDVQTIMTCLTITPDTISEAVKEKADLIVSHHPFPFFQEKKWTSDTPNGRILLSLIESGIAVYSPHTAHDSALYGINEQIALRLELQTIRPLKALDLEVRPEMLTGIHDPQMPLANYRQIQLGIGRTGSFPEPITLRQFTDKVHNIFNCPMVQVVGDDLSLIRNVAIGCGSAIDFLEDAIREKADVYLTGEAKFHDWLKAQELDIALVMPGHFYSERFAMDVMAVRISSVFPDLTVWASKTEKDPIHYL